MVIVIIVSLVGLVLVVEAARGAAELHVQLARELADRGLGGQVPPQHQDVVS